MCALLDSSVVLVSCCVFKIISCRIECRGHGRENNVRKVLCLSVVIDRVRAIERSRDWDCCCVAAVAVLLCLASFLCYHFLVGNPTYHCTHHPMINNLIDK